MSGKNEKKIRRNISKLFGDAVETIKVYVAELPLKDRLKLAKNIVFKRSLNFKRSYKHG